MEVTGRARSVSNYREWQPAKCRAGRVRAAACHKKCVSSRGAWHWGVGSGRGLPLPWELLWGSLLGREQALLAEQGNLGAWGQTWE